MRLAIISDTHFGDEAGTLVRMDENLDPVIGPKYPDFKKAVGKHNDYLVLLGDIFDFSIASYEKAYKYAKTFFLQIQKDQLAKECIIVPGNHDAGLWHIVEHEVNTINPIRNGHSPRPFRFSLPGVIDDRKDSPFKGFSLPGVREQKTKSGPRYAGLYLDNITVTTENNQTVGEPTFFNFCYPNVYLVSDNDAILLTHGQYLESYWAMAGEWAMKLAPEDLKVGSALDLKEMVAINFPLTQLACTGAGQAGPLTRAVSQLQRDVKDRDMQRVKRYLDRMDNELDRIARYPWYRQYMEWLTDAALDKVKDMIVEAASNMEQTRYSEEFIHKKEVQERFMRFYKASLLEIDDLNRKHGLAIPAPFRSVIFGHTHQPISWNNSDAPKAEGYPGHEVKLFNTGGWLNRKKAGVKQFVGAEIFTYSTKDGVQSFSIR